ncbi:MAG: phage tail spike protein [Oscillospiraceae bacterium]|nr:phage tail spike protein [Oscillospiraceae bacterium]
MSDWYLKSGQMPYKKKWPVIDAAAEPAKYTSDKAFYISRMWHLRDGMMPYKTCWPYLYNYCDAVHQSDYICVYDMSTAQNDFNNNGIAILTPSKCEITEVLNAEYELVLEHPIDAMGKWKKLLELNIIKAGGQLFRIYRKTTNLNGRTVYARHIFYDMSDKMMGGLTIIGYSGDYNWISGICNGAFNDDPQNAYCDYDFSFDSDMQCNLAGPQITVKYDGMSMVAALVGDDQSFISLFGGELYRDNFYFSINEHKENSVENAFNIRYGADMLEIEEEIDYTDWCTYLICEDNYGQSWAVSYVALPQIPHNVVKKIKFNYDQPNFEQLKRDGQAYFQEHMYPKTTYTVVYANLKNDPRYKDFIDLQHCNVGDTGTLFCEELGIDTIQKIIKKTTDVLTGSTTSIELGNLQSTLTRKDKWSNLTESSAATEALQKQLHEAIKKSLGTHKMNGKYTHRELSQFTHKELKGV